MDHTEDRIRFNKSRRAERGEPDNDEVRVHMMMRSAFRRGLLVNTESLTESSLVIRFGATRDAVRSALRRFTEDGLLRRQPRNGTWFTSEPRQIQSDLMFPVLRGTRSELATIVSLSESTVSSSEIMRQTLKTDEVDFVRYEELILIHGLPSAIRTIYVPLSYLSKRINDSDELPLSRDHNYERDFEVLFGRKLGRLESIIDAIAAMRPIPALGIETGDVLLNRESLAHDRDGIPRMLAFTSYKASSTSIHSLSDFSEPAERTRGARRGEPMDARAQSPGRP